MNHQIGQRQASTAFATLRTKLISRKSTAGATSSIERIFWSFAYVSSIDSANA